MSSVEEPKQKPNARRDYKTASFTQTPANGYHEKTRVEAESEISKWTMI